jgi:hypothetical protein
MSSPSVTRRSLDTGISLEKMEKELFPPFQSVQEEDYSESPANILQHDVLH